MKRLLLILTIFLSSYLGGQAQQKLYPQIKKVNIFRQSAQIEKNIEISLEKGFNEIILCGNSYKLSPQSIQFNSSKDYIITDFSSYTQFVKTNQQQEDKLSEKDKQRVTAIKDSIEILRDNRKIVRDKIDILFAERIALQKMKELEYPNKIDSISSIKEGLEFYEKKSVEISKLLYDLNLKDIELHDNIRKQKGDLQIILQEDNQNNRISKQEYYIRLNLYSESKIEKTVIVYKYNVSDIEWSPIYDIKFSTKNEPVQFILKSELQQTTGEDWDNIDMTFSTEEQNSNLQPLELKPMVYKKKSPDSFETGKRLTSEEIETMTANSVDAIIAQVGGVSDVEAKGGTARGESGMVTYVNGVAKKGSVNIPKKAIAEVQVELVGTRANDNGSSYNSEKSKGIFSQDIEKMAEPKFNNPNTIYRSESNNTSNNEIQTGYEVVTENASKGLSSSSSLLSEEYNVKMKYSIKSGDKPKIIPLDKKITKVNYKYFSVPKKERFVYLAALLPYWEDLSIVNAKSNIYIDDKFVNSTFVVPNQTADTLKLFVGREKNVVIDRKITKQKPTPTNRKATELEQIVNVKIVVKNNNNKSIEIKIDDQIPISSSEQITITKGDLSGATYDEKTGILYWELSLKALESKTINFSYTSRYPKNVILPID